jgi:hypothetical protein
MPNLRVWFATVLIAVIPAFVLPAFAALAAQKDWFANLVDAKGGCRNIHLFSTVSAMDGILFGKRLLDWSDDDIATAVRIYKDCVAKNHADAVNRCVRVGGRDCERKIGESERNYAATFELRFERGLRNVIIDARNRDAQRKAQETARIELEKSQLLEQAKRDREAAKEARRSAEREEPRIAEATREAEEAQRARQEAEERLAKIRSQIEDQDRARKDALAQTQRLERQAELDKRTSGYQRISVETFVLDGKDLATRSAKVSLSGTYIREGNLGVLYANQRAVMIAGAGMHQPSVLFLTDDASREFRQHLLMCQSNPGSARMGCPVTVVGHATMCSISNAFGGARESPCVAVEEGW